MWGIVIAIIIVAARHIAILFEQATFFIRFFIQNVRIDERIISNIRLTIKEYSAASFVSLTRISQDCGTPVFSDSNKEITVFTSFSFIL